MSNNSTKESPFKDESILEKLDAAQLEKMPLVASLADYYGRGISKEAIKCQEDMNSYYKEKELNENFI